MKKILMVFIAALLLCLDCNAQTSEPVKKPELAEQPSDTDDTTESSGNLTPKTDNTSTTEASNAQDGEPPEPKKKTHHDEDSFSKPANALTIIFGSMALIVSLTSLWLSRKSNQNQNRAYVHASKAEVTRDPLGTRISLEAINTGPTPAKWWETGYKCGLYKPSEASLKSHLEFESIDNFSRWSALANGSPLDAGLCDSDEQDLISKAVQTRDLCFFVYGIIRYKTIFDETFESQFVFFNPNPIIGTKLSRPNIEIESYKKVSKFYQELFSN